MDLRCPKCNSNNLKNVSLAYQKGTYHIDTRSRMRGLLFAGGGPDILVGRTTTRGSQQSALSRQLSPPTKWSYLKVGSWSVLAFLCIGWLVFYVNFVTTNSSTVISTPLIVFAMAASGVFCSLLFLVWKHNHTTFH